MVWPNFITYFFRIPIIKYDVECFGNWTLHWLGKGCFRPIWFIAQIISKNDLFQSYLRRERREEMRLWMLLLSDVSLIKPSTKSEPKIIVMKVTHTHRSQCLQCHIDKKSPSSFRSLSRSIFSGISVILCFTHCYITFEITRTHSSRMWKKGKNDELCFYFHNFYGDAVAGYWWCCCYFN